MKRNYPKDLIMQAGLYAYLLGVQTIYMVTSYLQPEDYENPNSYKCTEENTCINCYQLDDYFKGFKKECIEPALEWWNKYITTGTSPKPTTADDMRIINLLHPLRCPVCNATTLKKQNDEYICLNCNTISVRSDLTGSND